jgi:PilZ domain-containing protein
MGRFVMRKNQRFRASVPVLYGGKGVAGEGMIKDLSLSGWQIKGNEPVTVGIPLALRVFLPGELEPLRIDPAIVQWVKGLEFGVEFDALPRKVQDRIEQIIAGFVQKQHGSSSRGSLKKTGKVSGT